MATLVVVLVVIAVIAALIMGYGGFGPRVIRRTRIVDRAPLETPVRRRRIVEEETVDRGL